MRKPIALVFLVLLLIIVGNGVSAAKWETMKTESFTIFYPTEMEEHAYQVLQILEHYRPAVEEFTGNSRKNMPIVINDTGVLTNGYANSALNWIQLFWYPPEAGMIGTIEDWNSLVAVHEYTHILQMTNASGVHSLLTSIFGDIMSPNNFVPLWMIEGLAVYSESRLWNYQGRLNDGAYDAYIGARVADGRFPTILEATFAPHEFQQDGIYTYGSTFINYLAKTYGEAKLTEFINVQGSSLFSLNSNARLVFGKNFKELWSDWQAYEIERFNNYSIDGMQVTRRGWDITSPLLKSDTQTRKLYYQAIRPVKVGAGKVYYQIQIVERDLVTQLEKVLRATTSSFALPLREHDNKLYYGIFEKVPGYANERYMGYGYTVQLRAIDLQSGKEQLVLTAPIRAYDILPNGDLLYAQATRDQFGSEIYLVSLEHGQKLIKKVNYLIDEIAIDEHQIIMAARTERRNTDLYHFNINTGGLEPILLTPYAEYGISLSNQKLFFHANYESTYAAYCYDLQSGQLYKMTKGNFAKNPVFDADNNQLYFLGLNSYGYDVYRKNAEFTRYQIAEYPEENWPKWNLKGVHVTKGDALDNIKTLAPKVMLPSYAIPEQEGEELLLSISFLGGDALGKVPIYQTALIYSVDYDRWYFETAFDLNLYPPLNIKLGFSNYLESLLSLDLNYPFVNRLAPGLSDLVLGSKLTYSALDELQLTPYGVLGFRFPGLSSTVSLQFPIYSGVDNNERFGIYGSLDINKYFNNSELVLSVTGIYDPDNPKDVFPKLRGYKNPLNARIGGVYTAEYSLPVIRIRDGFSFLYFEDLWTSLFVDSAISKGHDYQLAGGIELYQEIKLDLGLATIGINPGIGIGFNREGERVWHFVVKGSF